MTVYTDAFTASNIYPSEISYGFIALTALNPAITLGWPEETSTYGFLATRIMDVTATNAGYSITLPDASKSGTGNTILFNNKGANTFTVKNNSGTQVMTVAPSTLWQIYLTDNSMAAGVWSVLEYGASTSTANASALAGTGIVAVGTVLSQSVPVTEFNSSFAVGINDRAKFYNWTGAAGTLTLPTPASVGDNWFIYLRNSGTGDVAANPPGSVTINGLLSLDFAPGDSAIIVSDGTNFSTIGYGQAPFFEFDYTTIDVSGTGNYTLTSTELNRIAYSFTGLLTGNRAIIVPNTVQQYWVSNNTTGSFTLSIKTAAGSAVTVSTAENAILYSNGTGVVRADTAGVSSPIGISDGGTGATTASAAVINLGASSTGIAVFESATPAIARAAIGATAVGDALIIAVSSAAARTALGATTVGNALFIAATQAAAWTALGTPPVGVVDGGAI
jgi:hypothetical protein